MKSFQVKRLRTIKLLIIITVALFLYEPVLSQQIIRNCVSKKHSDKFGHLIVQNYNGRFEPVHTLANDVIHKICKKDHFTVKGKGEMNAIQVFMDIIIDFEFWNNEKIIYLKDKAVAEKIGLKEKYVSFNEIFPDSANYKIRKYASESFIKKPKERNDFDKEIIKIDERVNLYMKVMDGSLLKLFPSEYDTNNKWISWIDTSAFYPVKSKIRFINEDLMLADFCYSNLFTFYLARLIESTKNDDYAISDKLLNYFNQIQQQEEYSEIIPSKTKIGLEVIYNKIAFFSVLKNIYGLLGTAFLIFFLLDSFWNKFSKFISISKKIIIMLMYLSFIVHTLALGIRWYLTEHAPWSNSYEVLLLVAWTGILNALLFIRTSEITAIVSCLLAFVMLMVAGHSYFDPQLGNLQPQLNSYWLIFHVVTITIAYGLFAICFLLGIFYLIFNILSNSKNTGKTDLIIREITLTNELIMIAGVFSCNIGTFLGGVWANESWGRYWGWDAKETWSLIIILSYSIVLHLRLIPKLKNDFIFNTFSIFAFGTVIMTFVGVNFYFSKGQHTYATGDTPVFPIWAWLTIAALIVLTIISSFRNRNLSKQKR